MAVGYRTKSVSYSDRETIMKTVTGMSEENFGLFMERVQNGKHLLSTYGSRKSHLELAKILYRQINIVQGCYVYLQHTFCSNIVFLI